VYHISYFTKIAICHPLDGRLDRTCALVGQQGLRAPQIKIKGFYQKKTSPTALINTSLPIFIPSKFISIVDIKREKIRGPNPINPTSAKSSRLFFHPQRKLPPSSTLSPPAHPPCCSTLSPPLPPLSPACPSLCRSCFTNSAVRYAVFSSNPSPVAVGQQLVKVHNYETVDHER
jgi:hypothetical protein